MAPGRAWADYPPDQEKEGFAPAVIDVLTLGGHKVSSVVGFLTDAVLDQPQASAWMSGTEVFARFGLPNLVRRPEASRRISWRG